MGMDDSSRSQISPRDYLKMVEAADKALEEFSTEGPAARNKSDISIHEMLAQIPGVLSAEKSGLITNNYPRATNGFSGPYINDGIPILMDSKYFSLNGNEKETNEKSANEQSK